MFICAPKICLYVFWTTSELKEGLVPLNMFKPTSKNVLTDRSKALLLLWIFLVICSSCFSLLYCLYVLWSSVVTSWESADLLALVRNVFFCFCHFPIWCPRSGVVLDCINSWSLPSSLLLNRCLEHLTILRSSCFRVSTGLKSTWI